MLAPDLAPCPWKSFFCSPAPSILSKYGESSAYPRRSARPIRPGLHRVAVVAGLIAGAATREAVLIAFTSMQIFYKDFSFTRTNQTKMKED